MRDKGKLQPAYIETGAHPDAPIVELPPALGTGQRLFGRDTCWRPPPPTRIPERKEYTHAAYQVRNARLLRSWTQQQLADKLGVTVLTVARWETQTKPGSPNLRQLAAIARVADYPIEQIGRALVADLQAILDGEYD